MATFRITVTVVFAVFLLKHVAGAVTVSGSGGTGIPNQQDLTLGCSYTVTPGDVVTDFTWRRVEGSSRVNIVIGSVSPKSAVFLDSWQNKGVFVGDYTSSLDIQLPASHVTSSYAGTYWCEVSTALSGTGNDTITASVLNPPSVSGLPPVQTVTEFSTLRIDCSTYTTPGNPPTTSYRWTYGGSTVSPGAVLDRQNISRSQGGDYTCTANNSQGANSASVNVDVQYGPYQISLTPSTSFYTVTEHQALPSVMCSALCRPGCRYGWLHNGTAFSSGAMLQGQADRSKTGSYRCQASNTHGRSDSVTVSVDVQYPAKINTFTANSGNSSLTVNEFDSVTLRCKVDSNPRSVIRLQNGSEEMTRADNSLTATYRMEPADCRQRGDYSCTATNNIGAPVTQRVELLVKCSTRLDESFSQQLKYASGLGRNVTISVSVLAYPLPTFTWSRSNSTSQDLTGSSSPVSDISVTARLHLTNLQQQDFGDYSLTVDNGVVAPVTYKVSVVSAGPPQTPTKFRDLDNATSSSVWLSWMPGFNGGQPQTFLVEYLYFPTRKWTVYNSYHDTGKMMVIEVSGLTPAEIYIFRLHARNDYEVSHGYVIVEAVTVGDKQNLDATYISTGVLAGATVGSVLLTLLIGGTVLMVMYRKGYRFKMVPKGDARKSASHLEHVELDNRGYSSLDQINAPAQYFNVEEESEKQQYTQLKIYENTKADAAADTSTYEGATDTPPVTYESINTSPYQNSGAQPQDPPDRNA